VAFYEKWRELSALKMEVGGGNELNNKFRY